MKTLPLKEYYSAVSAVQITHEVIQGFINGTILKPPCLYMFGQSADGTFIRLSLQTVSGHDPVFTNDWIVFIPGSSSLKVYSDAEFNRNFKELKFS